MVISFVIFLSFVLHYRDVQTCHFVLNGFISSCLSQTLLYSALFCHLCIWLYFCISLFLYLQSGLTPLHLAAQEDKVNVAEVLCNQGAFIDPETKVMIASSCLWIKVICKVDLHILPLHRCKLSIIWGLGFSLCQCSQFLYFWQGRFPQKWHISSFNRIIE